MLKVRIETKNDAFQNGNREYEVGRILTEIRDKVYLKNLSEGIIHDYNGNKVGEWKLTNR